MAHVLRLNSLEVQGPVAKSLSLVVFSLFNSLHLLKIDKCVVIRR